MTNLIAILSLCCTLSLSPDQGRLRQCQVLDTKPTTVNLVIDSSTKVLLNGRPWSIKKIPQGAEVIRLEVGANKETIILIEFRTKSHGK